MKEYPNLTKAISLTINFFRKERRMSKSALAEFAFLERKYLFEIEKETKKPTLNALYCICDALSITPMQFFEKLEEIRKRLNNSDSE